jgi:hypothetical protein
LESNAATIVVANRETPTDAIFRDVSLRKP